MGFIESYNLTMNDDRRISDYILEETCMMRASAAPAAMDIEPDDIDVSDSVNFVWEIK